MSSELARMYKWPCIIEDTMSTFTLTDGGKWNQSESAFRQEFEPHVFCISMTPASTEVLRIIQLLLCYLEGNGSGVGGHTLMSNEGTIKKQTWRCLLHNLFQNILSSCLKFLDWNAQNYVTRWDLWLWRLVSHHMIRMWTDEVIWTENAEESWEIKGYDS